MTQEPQGFFKKIGDFFMKGVVVEELEAEMFPTDSPGARKIGELEFTRFKPGNTRFEIEIKRRADIPAGDEVAVLIHGVEVCRVTIHPMKTEVNLFSDRGDQVPTIKPGDEASLVHNGQVIATGVFRIDD